MIRFANRYWVIINTEDVTDEMIENAMQSSIKSCRKTNDGSKVLLKWEGETPSCFEGITKYKHSEILAELKKDEWVGEL